MAEVRQYIDNPENRKRLFQFYEDVYPGSPWLLDQERFVWQSLRNPHHKEGETYIWLLFDDDQSIIGQNIYIVNFMSVAGKSYPGNCSTNLIVRPELIGKRLGHKLIQVNEDLPGIAYAVGITPASTRAFVKRGWVLVEDAHLHTAVVKPFPILKYVGYPRWKRILLFPAMSVVSIAARLIEKVCVPRKMAGITYHEIESFSSDWDHYWDSFLTAYAIHFKRNAYFLNYKYCSRRDVRHHILLFKKGDVPIGYGVFRYSENSVRGIKLGRLVDCVYDPNIGYQLVKFIVGVMKRKLLELKVDGIVGVASNKEIGKAMKANGFLLSRTQAAIIKETDFRVDKLRSRYEHLWYITLADSDLDNYW